MSTPDDRPAACTPTLPGTERRNHLLLLALLGVLLLVVPCGIPTLWDRHEGRFLESARGMLETGDWIVPRNLGEPLVFYPPLSAWLIGAASLLLGGLSEFSARLPFALASVACVLLAYELGRLLYDGRTGRLAAIALLTTALWPRTSILCQPDSLVVLLLMASLYALLRLDRAPRRSWPWAVLYWAAVALSAMAKGPPGVAGTIAVSGAWILWERKWGLVRRLNPALGAGIVVLVVAPWCVLAAREAGTAYLSRMWHEAFDMAAGGKMLMHAQPWYFYFAKLGGLAPWVVFALAALLGVPDDPRDRSARRFLLAWAGTILLMLSVAKAKRPYYLLPIYPAVALLAATWWTRVPRTDAPAARWRERIPLLFVAAAVVAALIVPSAIPEARLVKQGVPRTALVAGAVVAALACLGFLFAHLSGRRRAGFGVLAGVLFAALAVQQTWGAHAVDAEGRRGAAFCASVRAHAGAGPLLLYDVDAFVPFYVGRPFLVVPNLPAAAEAAHGDAQLLTRRNTWNGHPELQREWLPVEDALTELGDLVLCRARH